MTTGEAEQKHVHKALGKPKDSQRVEHHADCLAPVENKVIPVDHSKLKGDSRRKMEEVDKREGKELGLAHDFPRANVGVERQQQTKMRANPLEELVEPMQPIDHPDQCQGKERVDRLACVDQHVFRRVTLEHQFVLYNGCCSLLDRCRRIKTDA